MNNETDAIIAALRQAVEVNDEAKILEMARALAQDLTDREDAALAYFEGQR